nr:protoporphyrinogen oxidase HemJ [uncultured Gellertiella sp.]
MEQQTSAKAGKKAAVRASIALAGFAAFAAFLLQGDPGIVYLWVKALHVIAVISWMAGLLYMPRLFIYHGDSEKGSVQSETFKVMERRLLNVIMTPAMLLSWLLGLYMAAMIYHFEGGWLHAKLLAVAALTGVHVFFARAVGQFGRDENTRSPRFWRLANEIPTVLMIVIVILVIVKPF